MNKKTSFILLFLFSALYGYSQFKSGFIFGHGKGIISNVDHFNHYTVFDDSSVNLHHQYYRYKFDATIGYKFRIAPQNKPVFYDIDIYIGFRRFDTGYTAIGEYFIQDYDSKRRVIVNEECDIEHIFHSLSLNPSWNYRLVKGLYAGVGIEPTIYNIGANGASKYFWLDNDYMRWKFDLPLTAKVGYDLKFIDFSIYYKHGLFDAIDYGHSAPGKFRNLLLSVFIPF
jgi:hypothetical protein